MTAEIVLKKESHVNLRYLHIRVSSLVALTLDLEAKKECTIPKGDSLSLSNLLSGRSPYICRLYRIEKRKI